MRVTAVLFPCVKTINTPPTGRPIEEEKFADYKPENFYPTRIGEILESPLSSYKIVGKLDNAFYTLKIGTTHIHRTNREAAIYAHLRALPATHVGRKFTRTLHEAFTLSGPDGRHHCLVHVPLGMNLAGFQDTFPEKMYPDVILKGLVVCLLHALDFLHDEAGVVHTDIQARNILISLADESPLHAFLAAKHKSPTPRKSIDSRRTIYASRPLEFPLGEPTLCDFGLAIMEPGPHSGTIQPLPLRAPEVMLGMEWGKAVDIWNLGTLIWQLSFNAQLFDGDDETGQLERMIAYLGPPLPEFVARIPQGVRELYFKDDGVWKGAPVTPTPIGEVLEGEEAEEFLDLLRGMLAWVPGERKTTRELLEHPWLRDDTDGVGEEAGEQ